MIVGKPRIHVRYKDFDKVGFVKHYIELIDKGFKVKKCIEITSREFGLSIPPTLVTIRAWIKSFSPENKVSCELCGKEFWKSNHTTRFCKACRVDRKSTSNKVKETRECKWCHKLFVIRRKHDKNCPKCLSKYGKKLFSMHRKRCRNAVKASGLCVMCMEKPFVDIKSIYGCQDCRDIYGDDLIFKVYNGTRERESVFAQQEFKKCDCGQLFIPEKYSDLNCKECTGTKRELGFGVFKEDKKIHRYYSECPSCLKLHIRKDRNARKLFCHMCIEKYTHYQKLHRSKMWKLSPGKCILCKGSIYTSIGKSKLCTTCIDHFAGPGKRYNNTMEVIRSIRAGFKYCRHCYQKYHPDNNAADFCFTCTNEFSLEELEVISLNCFDRELYEVKIYNEKFLNNFKRRVYNWNRFQNHDNKLSEKTGASSVFEHIVDSTIIDAL